MFLAETVIARFFSLKTVAISGFLALSRDRFAKALAMT
jgi:hypothetical protein